MKAQGVALDLGYKYQTRNLGYTGLSFSMSSGRPYDSGTTKSFTLGAGGYWGSFNGSHKIIPTGYASFGFGGAALLDTKVSVSKHFFNPSVGFNALNFCRLDFGYSFPFEKINGVKMKGFTIGLNISLGTRGYYVDLSN